jgi:hypothetical protein
MTCKYQSSNPEFPFAGESIARLIRDNQTRRPGIIRGLIQSCDYREERHDFGDIIFRNPSNGDRLRMVYINRDAWGIADESHRGLNIGRWMLSEAMFAGFKVGHGLRKEFEFSTRSVWEG